MLWTVISFVSCTMLVAVIAYFRTRKENLDESDGYFLAGRGLSGWRRISVRSKSRGSSNRVLGGSVGPRLPQAPGHGDLAGIQTTELPLLLCPLQQGGQCGGVEAHGLGVNDSLLTHYSASPLPRFPNYEIIAGVGLARGDDVRTDRRQSSQGFAAATGFQSSHTLS